MYANKEMGHCIKTVSLTQKRLDENIVMNKEHWEHSMAKSIEPGAQNTFVFQLEVRL